jgi:ABC-type multidrug transport system fused ATPase/permease subunit
VPFANRRRLFVTSSLEFLKHYLRPHRGSTALLAAIIVVTIALQIATPVLTGRFIDRATDGDPVRSLITIAVATIVIGLIVQALTVAETWVAETLAWSATNALRLDLAAHVLRLDYAFHVAHAQGELIERVDGDVGNLARFFSRFFINVIGNGLLILGIVVLLVLTDWRIGLGMAVFTSVAFAGMLYIRLRATPYWTQERQANAGFYGFLGEYLDGLEDVRASGPPARAFVLRRFVELMRGWLAITTRAQMWGYGLMATSTGVFTLGLAFALAVSGSLYRSDALTLGQVFLVFRLATMLREPTDRLRNEVQDFQQAAAGLVRVQALLAERPSITDGIGTAIPACPLSVELDDVTFSYANGAPVLRNFSLRIEPGRVLGIVGRTGSGKSTLTRLIPRFLDPDSGVVRVGGVDVRETTLAELRGRIGVVPQDVRLFDATLRDNLTLFEGGEFATDARLRDVVESLGLGDWMISLPDGLDSRLGAGGVGLSAGQMQVISCARVLLRDPDIVILDEASARLDPATEQLLHTALSKLLADRTGIIVAHRLDTLSFANDIAVITDGELREHGPREALAADPASHFASLLRLDILEHAR